MATYIILFRGVGGATQLPTAPLREALTQAGFANVATYINSGNAVVSSALARSEVIESIAQICRKKFTFDKAIYALNLTEWNTLIRNNPFPDFAEGKFLHAAWLAEKPKASDVDALKAIAQNGDAFAVVGKVAYIHTPDGFGKSKLAEKFDKRIGVPNTARNWNTVLKLLELGKGATK